MKTADCPCKNSRLNEILLFYLFCFFYGYLLLCSHFKMVSPL